MLGKSIFVLLVSFAAYKYYEYTHVEDSPIVSSENGALKGKISISRNGKPFYEYMGIPYGKPPVDQLRYESPLPAENWEGVRLAQAYGAECAQVDFMIGKVVGEEDCLFLNVATPKIGKDSLLPVLVFIHGGLFVFGSSNPYGGHYFMDEDVIVVTINYRLASLGFLNTGDGLVRGNMGLRDQILALQWVQKNIGAFGGDKNKVTIFGESAGSAAVNYHLISPLSKGLFYRAISQSGTILNPWALKQRPAEQAKRHAEQVNCPTSTSKEMVACLKKKPVADILDAHMETINIFRDLIAIFRPTVEINKEGAVIPAHPYDILRSGKVNTVPWMTGYNKDEGQIFFAWLVKNESGLAFMEKNLASELPKMMLYENGDKEHRTELVGKMMDFYFGDVKPAGFGSADIYSQMFTDGMFAYANSEAMKLHSEFQPVYPYYFTYHGKTQVANLMMSLKGKYPMALEALYYFAETWVNENILGRQPLLIGASHADELILLFELTQLSAGIGPGHVDYEMSKNLVRLWASFAKGEDNIKFLGKPLTRLEKDAKEVEYLELGTTAKVIPEPNLERLNFWRKNSVLIQ